MKIGVVGSRTSNNTQRDVLISLLKTFTKPNIKLVSGGCYAGADRWAEEYAKENNLEIIIHKPNGFNPQDFHNRNNLIVNNSDMLIATIPENPNPDRFAGTEQSVRESIERGIFVVLINPKGELIYYNKDKEERKWTKLLNLQKRK